MRRSAATDAFWASFRAARPNAPAEYRLTWFGGDDAGLATELARLVRDGPKRATTTLLRDLETGAEPHHPAPGDLWLLVDGEGAPVAVLRTTAVEQRRFGDVDAAFARAEGEGDRSLADWRRAHRAYFQRQATAGGFVFDDAAIVVLERFRLVWPDDVADPA